MTKLDKTHKLMRVFLAEFEAKAVLPSMKPEYQEVGFWHGLWLKITKQDTPVKCSPLPECKGDTITIKRPKSYKANSYPAPGQ